MGFRKSRRIGDIQEIDWPNPRWITESEIESSFAEFLTRGLGHEQ